MVNTGKVDCLLDVHSVIHYVRNDTKHGVDDGWTTGRSYREPEAAVLSQNDRRCHCRKWPLLRRNCVTFALDQSIHIRRAWFGGKVVHLIVQEYAGTFDHCGRAV